MTVCILGVSVQDLTPNYFAWTTAQNRRTEMRLSFVLPAFFLIPMMTFSKSTGVHKTERYDASRTKPMCTYHVDMTAVESIKYGQHTTFADTALANTLDREKNIL